MEIELDSEILKTQVFEKYLAKLSDIKNPTKLQKR